MATRPSDHEKETADNHILVDVGTINIGCGCADCVGAALKMLASAIHYRLNYMGAQTEEQLADASAGLAGVSMTTAAAANAVTIEVPREEFLTRAGEQFDKWKLKHEELKAEQETKH